MKYMCKRNMKSHSFAVIIISDTKREQIIDIINLF